MNQPIYKGTSQFDTGYFYTPYIPLQVVNVVHEWNWDKEYPLVLYLKAAIINDELSNKIEWLNENCIPRGLIHSWIFPDEETKIVFKLRFG